MVVLSGMDEPVCLEAEQAFLTFSLNLQFQYDIKGMYIPIIDIYHICAYLCDYIKISQGWR